MALQDSIFIFDLHNTLYDEVMEYGGAMAAALEYVLSAARERGISLEEDELCRDLAKAHAVLGSDWDPDVWDGVLALKGLRDFSVIKDGANAVRLRESEALTKRYAYAKTLNSIRSASDFGARFYLATEATYNAAADGLFWLDLDGDFESVYSWPYAKSFRTLRNTQQKTFPDNPECAGASLQKPHPFILAQILLDIAKSDELIDADVCFSDVFEGVQDDDLDVSALLSMFDHVGHSVQAEQVVRAIQTRLVVKDTPYKGTLEDLRARCFYVGDSFFKDGFLARNAEIPFIYAEYGKNISDAEAFERAKDILYRVTGWEPFLLQLTQEAGKLPALTDKVVPYFTCRESFQEFLDYWEKK